MDICRILITQNYSKQICFIRMEKFTYFRIYFFKLMTKTYLDFSNVLRLHSSDHTGDFLVRFPGRRARSTADE